MSEPRGSQSGLLRIRSGTCKTLVAHGLTVREVAARISVCRTAPFASLSRTPSDHIEGSP